MSTVSLSTVHCLTCSSFWCQLILVDALIIPFAVNLFTVDLFADISAVIEFWYSLLTCPLFTRSVFHCSLVLFQPVILYWSLPSVNLYAVKKSTIDCYCVQCPLLLCLQFSCLLMILSVHYDISYSNVWCRSLLLICSPLLGFNFIGRIFRGKVQKSWWKSNKNFHF